MEEPSGVAGASPNLSAFFRAWDAAGLHSRINGDGAFLDCRLDPLAPDNFKRTIFSFQGTDFRTVPSCFSPVDGDRTITLTPLGGRSRLVWNKRGQELFFEPDGEYGLQLDGDNEVDAFELICGARGSEVLNFQAGSGARISFYPGHGAHAKTLVPYDPVKNPGAAIADEQLSLETTTVYASVRAEDEAKPPAYRVMADRGSLYADSGHIGLAAGFPFASPVKACFPLIPHAGFEAGFSVFPTKDSQSWLMRLEEDYVFQDRYRLIADAAANEPVSASSKTRVLRTVQGIELRFSAQDRLEKALLADSSGGGLWLAADSPALRNLAMALQKGDSFIVLSGTAEKGLRGGLDLGGFTVSLDGKNSDPLENVLIVKLGRGRLIDWIRRPERWALGQALNSGLAGLADWLDGYLGPSLSENNRDSSLGRLSRDEWWTGLMLLNSPLAPETALPPALKALADGFSAEGRLRFHHIHSAFAVSARAGQETGGPRFSGLIDYRDPEYARKCAADSKAIGSPVDADGDPTRILTLKAEIENSIIKEAEYLLQVNLPRLFGSPIAGVRNAGGAVLPWPAAALMLDGRIFRQDGREVSTLSSKAPVIFETGSALAGIEITEAIRAAAESESELKLSLRGRLRFSQVKDFDIFSFGPDEGGEDSADGSGTGLAFANLVLAGGRAREPKTPLQADYSGLTFQVDDKDQAGQPRPGSLIREFPLVLSSLRSGMKGDESNRPPGYVKVDTGRSLADLGNVDWMGLEFTLSFGTLGGLGGHKPLEGRLITAWNPASTLPGKPEAAVWLQFPGAEGLSLPALQNFLRLGFSDLTLTRQTELGAEQFTLSFENAGLKVLGLSFPSGNTLDIRLVGGSGGGGQAGELAWLASLVKK